MNRDRFATRALILESAAALIAAHGVAKLGVNALADAAGCDKVLIYRYFGGLEGVLAALGEERMMWPKVVGASDDASLAEAMENLVLEEWAALSAGTLMLQAAASELTDAGPSLAASTADQRDAAHAAAIAELRERYRVPPYVDLAAITELLSAAMTTFALRAAHADPDKKKSSAVTLDPHSPQGWRRIEKTVAAIARALLDADSR